MDGSVLVLSVYLGAAFFAALVAGVSGFAFALIAAAAWLHVLTPTQTALLVASYGILVQSYGTWKMRHAINWQRIWPFLLGGAPGVAVGVMVQRWADPTHLRAGIGVFLVVYAAFNLLRPDLKPVRSNVGIDMGIGLLSGILGATAGFAGILIVIWCGLRGWAKDVQRGVFQPASVGMMAMCALALGVAGPVTRDVVLLFLAGLPALATGTYVGFRLYGRIDEAAFRRLVLILLLLSGLPLVVPGG